MNWRGNSWDSAVIASLQTRWRALPHQLAIIKQVFILFMDKPAKEA
jgi:hypothetical protein